MTAAEAQQTLDEFGVLDVPDDFQPEVPLFLPAASLVRGRRATAYTSGTFAFTGWRRGLLTPDHFPLNSVFRTVGDSYLFARGTEWDLGPQPGGWPSVTTLSVSFRGTFNGGPLRDGLVLAGIDDGSLGANDLHPAPWVLWALDGTARLTVTLADGTRSTATAPFDPTATAWAIDLTVPCPGGLAPNSTWPFGVFQCPPWCTGTGYWGTPRPVPDVTLDSLAVSDQAGVLCRTYPDKHPTYPGGPSLPLVVGWTRAGGMWLRAVRQDQGIDDSVSDVRVEGLAVTGRSGSPLFDYGAVMGNRGLVLDGVSFQGGTRALQGCGLGVSYPFAAVGCLFAANSDRNVYLARTSSAVLDRCTLSYGAEGAAELSGFDGVIRDSHLAPGGRFPPAVFVQRDTGPAGVTYERLVFDAEYPPGPGCFVWFRRPTAPGGWPGRAAFRGNYHGFWSPDVRVDADAGPLYLYAEPSPRGFRVAKRAGAQLTAPGLDVTTEYG